MAAPTWFGRTPLHAVAISCCVLPVAKARTWSLRLGELRMPPAGFAAVVRWRPAFIVVVIGGLGSFWGTFLGSVIYGQVLSFGILIFPGFSLFSVFALMAVILILRPWGLLGRPLR